jgi:hypothetical protein
LKACPNYNILWAANDISILSQNFTSFKKSFEKESFSSFSDSIDC